MNITLLIIGIATVGITVFVFYMCWTYKEEIKEIIKVRKHYHADDSIIVDQYVHNAQERIVYCPEAWTNENEKMLYVKNYIKCEKYKDKLRYYGIPVFIRFHGFTVLDLGDPETAESFGFSRPNKIGSATMHDFLKSNTLSRFMAGFTKVSFAPIDVKMLIIVAPIIIGVVLGMLYFMH